MSHYLYEEGLTAERLKTRFLTAEDYSPWLEFMTDPECTEFFSWLTNASDEERTKIWMEKQLLRYQEQRFGMQALVHKKTGEFIGQCGLLLQEIDGKQELEVGYHIFKKYWGQGYAPEASKAFFDYGFNHNLADSIISIIHIDNTKSQRVADKNGLKREKEVKWNGMDVYIYRIYSS